MIVYGVRATRLLPTFRQIFCSEEHAIAFLRTCVGKGEVDGWEDDPDFAPLVHPVAKSLVNQIHEIVEVADTTKSHYLRLVLLLTGAESVSKIVHKYHGGGYSRRYCKLFFDDFCQELHCAQSLVELVSASSLTAAVDELYDLRCKAIHEGWLEDWRGFPNWQLSNDKAYSVLRHVFVAGAVRAVHKAMDIECLASLCPGHDFVPHVLCSTNLCGYEATFRSDIDNKAHEADRIREVLQKVFRKTNG